MKRHSIKFACCLTVTRGQDLLTSPGMRLVEGPEAQKFKIKAIPDENRLSPPCKVGTAREPQTGNRRPADGHSRRTPDLQLNGEARHVPCGHNERGQALVAQPSWARHQCPAVGFRPSLALGRPSLPSSRTVCRVFTFLLNLVYRPPLSVPAVLLRCGSFTKEANHFPAGTGPRGSVYDPSGLPPAQACRTP